MFLWSALCMISEWKNFSRIKWITLAPKPSDVSWADTAACLWSLTHRNQGDRRWGEGLAVAPSPTLPPILAWAEGAGQSYLGSTCWGISFWWRTKDLLQPVQEITLLLGSCSFSPQKPFSDLFSLQTFSIQSFLKGIWLSWGDHFGQCM